MHSGITQFREISRISDIGRVRGNRRNCSIHRIVQLLAVAIAAVVMAFFSSDHAGATAETAAAIYDEPAGTALIYDELQQGKRVQPASAAMRHSVPEHKTVYLTFDDGPSSLTAEVLNILKQEHIQATFFVLGVQAQKQPELISRMVEEGHALGNHSYDHNYAELYSGFEEYWRQIEQTEDILQHIADVKPRLVRAPGGTHRHFDASYFYFLEAAGYEIHDWNMDSGDSRRIGVPCQEIVETVKKGPFPHEITLLLHDGPGHQESVKALPEIIDFFRQKGYRFAPLSEHVKPVQHSIGEPKWHKAITPGDFVRWQAAAEEKLAAWVKEPKKNPNIEPSEFRISDNRKQPALLSDVLSAAHSQVSYVPLREWYEQQGRKVLWHAPSKTVMVSHYEKNIFIDTQQRRAIIESRNGNDQMQSIDLFIDQGTLYISISDAIALEQSPIEIPRGDFSFQKGYLKFVSKSFNEGNENEVLTTYRIHHNGGMENEFVGNTAFND